MRTGWSVVLFAMAMGVMSVICVAAYAQATPPTGDGAGGNIGGKAADKAKKPTDGTAVEIQINVAQGDTSDDEKDDFICLTTAPGLTKTRCRAKLMKAFTSDVIVDLKNGAGAGGGEVRFPDDADVTKSLTLNKDGATWTEFYISGKTVSSAKDDAKIVAYKSGTSAELGDQNLTVVKVDFIEASSSKAANSPRQFEGHKTDFGNPHASDGADRALIIPYKNVRNVDLTVQDFDVTLNAHVLPPSITADQLNEGWAKVAGPASGSLNRTDTFEVKFQNAKKGGLYKCELDLGLAGCAKSGANVHLPLGGPNATAWCAVEANELIATATIIDGIEHVANRTICYIATSATLDWDYSATAEATQSGDSPCHVYGANETITIAGVVVSKPKFANFMWGYYCRMFYSGVDWWVQVLLAGSIGTGDTPECWEAYKAGKEWWDGATLETVMKDHGLGMQLSGEQTEKLWPSTDPYIGGKTGPAWFGMDEAELIVYCYYLLGIPLE